MTRLSDAEVVRMLGSGSSWDKARQLFRFRSAKIEQAAAQRKSLGSIEWRRMEFEAVQEIAEVLGVRLEG